MSLRRICSPVVNSRYISPRGVVLVTCACLSLVGSTLWAADPAVWVKEGKVGIGVDPSTLPLPTLLNVKGGFAGDAVIKVQNTANPGFSGIEFHNAGGTPGFFFGVDNSNDATRLNSFNDLPFLLMTNSQERVRITPQGNIGISRPSPLYPLHVGSDGTNGNGAHVTGAGVWTHGSSREGKANIRHLEYKDALEALAELEPVRYLGKNSMDGEEYLGFIAEEVPELVAMNDRKGLSSMDIVAVLTKVAQEQQRTVSELTARLAEMELAQATSQADHARCRVEHP